MVASVVWLQQIAVRWGAGIRLYYSLLVIVWEQTWPVQIQPFGPVVWCSVSRGLARFSYSYQSILSNMDSTSAICTPGLLHRPLWPCRFLAAVPLLCSSSGASASPKHIKARPWRIADEMRSITSKMKSSRIYVLHALFLHDSDSLSVALSSSNAGVAVELYGRRVALFCLCTRLT